MKILHTSDWHLGRSLYGRKRYHEFSAFLDWLGDCIRQQRIDLLLVAGDVFDTSTPSNRAQELYYRFLCNTAASCCRHIVVIGGNHDSPSFLNAPRELLRAIDVHVVGAITGNPADEVLVLRDEHGRPEAIVCAVPYLRDRDIRTVEPGESIDDKNAKLALGLKNHYAEVCAIAEQKRAESGEEGYAGIPIIAMGHLFTTRGKTVDGDGVRELYVGSLARVGEDVFPESVDYLALGHLHVPQRVAGKEHLRYCGSPLPMGFGEAGHEKKVITVLFEGRRPTVRELKIPCFQPLERVAGSLADICAAIERLKQEGSRAWLEIEYTGSGSSGGLRETLDELLADSCMEIRRIKNRQVTARVISSIQEDETLDDLDVHELFVRCLDAFAVPSEERQGLVRAYSEIIESLHEEDSNAQ